ncbi:uncharacterized protein LOC133466501 [Phyllopteryx taeniolatus]|uniref:uncharacterized protein LOC133466501 n=1 Tax=Phyllopteryx taeniolatus TaxID=161469 RepID=UPI002AD28632|nr:uncharacterized protein LOC133466501 [Phyllopteryx taeniolatus]XP_061606271.1 uncharacterized protein LOC133466501 [Phyllopteryx taeniolatus]XP_061606272.1 uncharacterized protein LOC133466501 [Phyllopteryx taeniolatus]
MRMESYEEFSLRSAATLQEEANSKRATREPVAAYSSVVLFCGKAVLSPLLSGEQRQQMRDLRRTAVQLETDRRNRQRNKVGDVPARCTVQAQGRTGSATKDGNKPACETRQVLCGEAGKSPSPRATRLSDYKLITDSPGLPKDPGIGVQTSNQPTSPVLNGLVTGDELKFGTEEKSDEDDMSMDSLFKQTKENVSKEQSKDGFKVVIPTHSPEAASENAICSPKSRVEFGFSLHRSPIGPPKIPFHQNMYDPDPEQPVSPSLPDQYIRQPSPESSLSPRTQRRKPRPFSTGNIQIVFPGMPWEGACRSDWEEALSGAAWSPDHWSSVSSNGAGVLNRRGSHRSVRCAISPMRETHSPVSPSLPSPIGQHDQLSSAFRRRCHTFDSQLHTDQAGSLHIDRSQERTPRFMAGVTMCTASRHNSAAPMNKSCKVENPSPHLRRPHVCPQVKLRTEPDEPRDETSPTALRNAADAHANNTGEIQRRAQILEDMQRRLEEEHALQMSLLLAEQEKEQQRLRLELEETERRLREQECEKLQTSDTSQWKRASVNDGLPAESPSASTPGHSIGFPSPISSTVTSPSAQSPVYLREPTWAAHKPQARLSQVLKAEEQRALCRISAIARGFLTRRLLKTHKVQHLRQTVTDTQEFISSFKTEGPQKRSTFSAQDLSLQDRVQAHLRAALYDIHEIFFEIPLEDRLALLQQDRELCAEKRQRDMEKAKKEKERAVLSAATQRSLDRKKREGESPGQARKVMQKPKSPTPIRVQKSSQVQKCVPSQLNRQGSWYKKTPEARVKRTDNLKNLKKQHSLG